MRCPELPENKRHRKLVGHHLRNLVQARAARLGKLESYDDVPQDIRTRGHLLDRKRNRETRSSYPRSHPGRSSGSTPDLADGSASPSCSLSAHLDFGTTAVAGLLSIQFPHQKSAATKENLDSTSWAVLWPAAFSASCAPCLSGSQASLEGRYPREHAISPSSLLSRITSAPRALASSEQHAGVVCCERRLCDAVRLQDGKGRQQRLLCRAMTAP